MSDKIVTLNYILVGVFCKSGRNVWYLFFAQKNKNKIAIKLNRKLFKKIGEKQQQFKAVLHLLFLCLNPFSSHTRGLTPPPPPPHTHTHIHIR